MGAIPYPLTLKKLEDKDDYLPNIHERIRVHGLVHEHITFEQEYISLNMGNMRVLDIYI